MINDNWGEREFRSENEEFIRLGCVVLAKRGFPRMPEFRGKYCC
jgi:hypothetical protein